MAPDFEAPRIGHSRWLLAIGSLLVCGAIFGVMPLTQYLGRPSDTGILVRRLDVHLPPPNPPPPEPPPPREQRKQEKKMEVRPQPKPLSLSQLELALNPGVEGAFAGAYAIGGFSVETDTLADVSVFEIADLDSVPVRVNHPLWVTSNDLKRTIKDQIIAKVIILIDERGGVSVENFDFINHPEARHAVADYVEKFRFSPPTRQGKTVRARYLFPVSIRM